MTVSQQQQTIALSACQAEYGYMALTTTTQERLTVTAINLLFKHFLRTDLQHYITLGQAGSDFSSLSCLQPLCRHHDTDSVANSHS